MSAMVVANMQSAFSQAGRIVRLQTVGLKEVAVDADCFQHSLEPISLWGKNKNYATGRA